ncbi:MAG: glycyl-radical enzyme activating protein, partial [Victivallales bacterium]|nr:glycyl-radical enzyme activating protein [Victivallales bacterium]
LALEDEAFYRQSGGGVTLSGGEPLMQPEFAEKLMQELRLREIHTALDTCACVREELFRRMLPCADLFLVDFKHADSQRHQELTGAGNELVKSNLTMLSEAGAAIEIRIPLIPGCNDDEENLVRTGEFLSRLQLTGVRLLPYHPYSTGKYQALDMPYNMPDVEIPDEAKLEAAADVLRQFGLNILK